MTSTLKAAQQAVGTDPAGRDANRADHDFYRTSPEAVLPLFRVEEFPGVVWEPACGDGAISKILEARPNVIEVISTDLVDRGYGTAGVDFLKCEWPREETPAAECSGRRGGFRYVVDHVITNPPYSLAVEFALRVLEEDRLPPGGKLALFCRTLFLEGQRRHKRLFQPFPPSRVWTHRARVPMARGPDMKMATGLISFSWFVWEAGWTGPTELGWL
jgi:hypothetical protein